VDQQHEASRWLHLFFWRAIPLPLQFGYAYMAQFNQLDLATLQLLNTSVVFFVFFFFLENWLLSLLSPAYEMPKCLQ
jgi:hypothetical protein